MKAIADSFSQMMRRPSSFSSPDHVLEKNASRFCQMALAGARFGLDGLEDKVCRVNLAVRMRIGNAHRFAFVFKDQHVLDLFARAELPILFLPNFEQIFDLARLEFGQAPDCDLGYSKRRARFPSLA